MKRNLFLAVLALGGLVSAQSHSPLAQQLEQQKLKNKVQYQHYIQQKMQQNPQGNYGAIKTLGTQTRFFDEKEHRLGFFFQNKPYFLTEDDTDQIKNANADALQEGKISGLSQSYNGEGISVDVFDGGRVYAKHEDFGNENRIVNKEKNSVDYSGHATGVTGMIGAVGHNIGGGGVSGNTKGIMPKATFRSYSFKETTLQGENSSKTVYQKIEAAQPYLSNHSYGINTEWEKDDQDRWYWNGDYDSATKKAYHLDGCYLESDRNYDDIVYAHPSMIIVKSAGNSYGDGPSGDFSNAYYEGSQGNDVAFTANDVLPPNNCADGVDCIGPGSLAKNIIVVGATEKLKTSNQRYTKTSDVEKASYSSAGPRDDGGIKPDIAGVGSDIFFPSTESSGSNSWAMGDGTSFSAPQVTGIIGLWLQIHKDLFSGKMLNAASAKALLIHSAQEAGNKGPDAWFGWGFADAKKGAEILLGKSNGEAVIFENKTLKNKAKEQLNITTDGKQPLKISIVWTDPSFKNLPTTYQDAHNNTASRLINDLDLRLVNTKTNQIYQPWKLDIQHPMAPAITGDNTVDNVEQILIDAPVAGIYRIEISHKNNLVNNQGKIANQDYALLVTGASIYDELSTVENENSIQVEIQNTLINASKGETLRLTHAELITTPISIYDASGRLVKTIDQIQSSSINLSGLGVGVYLVNFLTKTQKITKKIIVN